VLNRGLLSAQRRATANPKQARAQKILSCRVVEEDLKADWDLTHIEIVVHKDKDVNVVWGEFGDHKGTKDDEARQMAARFGQSVNMLQPPRYAPTLAVLRPKWPITSRSAAVCTPVGISPRELNAGQSRTRRSCGPVLHQARAK